MLISAMQLIEFGARARPVAARHEFRGVGGDAGISRPLRLWRRRRVPSTPARRRGRFDRRGFRGGKAAGAAGSRSAAEAGMPGLAGAGGGDGGGVGGAGHGLA